MVGSAFFLLLFLFPCSLDLFWIASDLLANLAMSILLLLLVSFLSSPFFGCLLLGAGKAVCIYTLFFFLSFFFFFFVLLAFDQRSLTGWQV